MKLKLILICVFFPFKISFAQKVSILRADSSSSSKVGKLIIDQNSGYSQWPYVSPYVPPKISRDGNFVAFIVNNQPIRHQKFVIKNLQTHWQREFVTTNLSNDYFFTKDNKKVVWINNDTLFTLNLETGMLDLISSILSSKFQNNNRGEWIAYQQTTNKSELSVINLVSGKKLIFTDVSDYAFNELGNSLVIKKSVVNDTNSLIFLDLENGISTTIWSAPNAEISSFSFDKKGSQLAFLVSTKFDSINYFTLWFFKKGVSSATVIMDNANDKLKTNHYINNYPPIFSATGDWLFFRLYNIKNAGKVKPNPRSVEVWNYKEFGVNSVQKNQYIIGVVNVNNSTVYLHDDSQQSISHYNEVTNDYLFDGEQKVLFEQTKSLFPTTSYSIISMQNGKRKIIKANCTTPITSVYYSPNGKWIVYWDADKRNYISYNVFSNISSNISKNIPDIARDYQYYSLSDNSTLSQPAGDFVGWFEDDSALLLYSQFDIWKVDPAGKKRPENITSGLGKRMKIILRLVYEKDEKGDKITFRGDNTLLLTGFNTQNKYNGFLKKRLNQNGDPVTLSMGPYLYFINESQIIPNNGMYHLGMQPIGHSHDLQGHWIVMRESFSEYPNFYYTKDFKSYDPLTSLAPQNSFNWIAARLISWKQFDGTISQGILYTPENFDSSKRYPVIFNYYEKLSHRIYNFPMPGLSEDNINIPWFVSRGYLVFTPDIYYALATKSGKVTGDYAYNSVVSAAKYLSHLSYVNSKRLSIQGHSFGGGETFSLVTRTGIFAAACAASATVSNQISAYLSLRQVDGKSLREVRMFASEAGHDMIGTTLWDRPDLYFKASPVLNANRVTTPLLIMHNKQDYVTDWNQSLEMYLALRRLGKKTWLLQYPNEAHSVIINKDHARDYTARLQQFFDHYLKNAPAPIWITQGIPGHLKGIITGYAYDPSGNCGIDCKVCKMWNEKMAKDSVATWKEIEEKKKTEDWQITSLLDSTNPFHTSL